MKKLALFVPSLRGGGAERVMVNLAQGFTQRGYAVDLVVGQAEGPYRDQVPAGVRVVDLRTSRMILCLPELTRYLRRERPFALLCAMDHANLVGLWARMLSGVRTRVILSVHISLRNTLKHVKGRKRRLLPVLMRWFYRQAGAVVTVSAGVREDVAEITGMEPEAIRVIYNPVVTPNMLDRAAEPVEHPWFHGEAPVILAAGRLTKQKDFPTLIRAFALMAQRTNARLVILGEGAERPRLEALVAALGCADRVSLPGFVENPYKYMAQASLFVLSSAWEGFGNVLVEAMAVGTPVTSTNCPSGPAEILEDGRYGRLVPVGDVQQLAEAMLTTLESPPEAAALQRRAREYSLERITDQYLEVLDARV